MKYKKDTKYKILSDAFYKSSFFLNYSTLLYGEQMQ